jgi:hypothetical protein
MDSGLVTHLVFIKVQNPIINITNYNYNTTL